MQGLRQELRLRQEMTLQPQQILRSELVQMATLELEMRIKSEIEDNPFLEELEERPEIDERADTTTDDDNDVDTDAVVDKTADEGAREVDWEDILNDSDSWEYRPRNPPPSEALIDIPQPNVISLSEKLIEQLHFDNLTDIEVEIGEEIIGNINRDGYLEATLEEIADTRQHPLELVERVHSRLIEYDPIGIGSRDLRECLLTQLRFREPRAEIAERMIGDCWEDFINKRFEIIAEKLEVTIDDIRDSFEVISHLNPKPGEGQLDERQNYVLPDLVVTKVGDKFEVFLSEGDTPNFRVSPRYREIYLNRKGADKKVKEYLARKFESARWFINAIHQRRTTMLRTMRAIVDRQIEFFQRGPAHLKPMILANIAEDIGMDISTISRVTNGKYVQTDQGIFELKYFFSEKMETDEGTDVSNRVIKARLAEMIDDENKKKPLSDQELTDMLNTEGFQIRRRTVAKYREQLRIPIKRLRREI